MGPEKFQIGTIKPNFTGLSKTYKRNAINKTTQHKIQFLKKKHQNNYLLLQVIIDAIQYWSGLF